MKLERHKDGLHLDGRKLEVGSVIETHHPATVVPGEPSRWDRIAVTAAMLEPYVPGVLTESLEASVDAGTRLRWPR